MTIRNTCIGAGSNQGTIYISEESNYTAESNFIDSQFVTSVCVESGLRLIQELPGSGCFDVNRTDCNFNCTSFVEVDTCMIQLETFTPSIAPNNVTQVPTAINNTTFQPTIATVTPSTVNMTFAPSQQPTPQPIPIAIPTSVPIALPPSFTATSSPTAAVLPTTLPTISPSRFPRPSLRPTPKTPPTSFETQLPTLTMPPSTFKPSCDCHSGKGKSKKMGKDKGMGKGKGGDSDLDSNDDWGIATYLSDDDDDANSYHRSLAHYSDTTDDDDDTESQTDDNCVCRESRKGKGKSKKGKGGHGKGKGKGKGKGRANDSHSDTTLENHESLSRQNHILHYLERNDNQR